LPIARKYRVGATNWGLVQRKTQTIYPWDSWQKPYDHEPTPWFHDIFRADGRPSDDDRNPLRFSPVDCVGILKAHTHTPWLRQSQMHGS
jgi:hypothetical protein